MEDVGSSESTPKHFSPTRVENLHDESLTKALSSAIESYRHTKRSKVDSGKSVQKSVAAPSRTSSEKGHLHAQPGVGLYYRAVQRREVMKEWQKAEKEFQQQQRRVKECIELEECIFKPCISKAAQRLPPSVNERHYSRSHRQHIESAEDCTFHPKIAEKSREMAAQRRVEGSSFETRLHDDDLGRRKVNSVIIRSVCDEVMKKNVIGCAPRSEDEAMQTIERLEAWPRRREKNIVELRDEIEKGGRGKEITVNTDEVVSRLCCQKSLPAAEPCSTFRPSLNSVSCALAAQARLSAYEKCFELLSVDGTVSVPLPPRSEIPTKLVEGALTEYLKEKAEPQETNDRLSREIFFAALERFEKMYGPQQWCVSHCTYDSPLRSAPQLTANTVALAAKRRDATKPIFMALFEESADRRTRKEETERQKVQEECAALKKTQPQNRQSKKSVLPSSVSPAQWSGIDILTEIEICIAQQQMHRQHSPQNCTKAAADDTPTFSDALASCIQERAFCGGTEKRLEAAQRKKSKLRALGRELLDRQLMC